MVVVLFLSGDLIVSRLMGKHLKFNEYTIFILIEARRASAGISPSDTVLISGENNYCDRNTTYPLYITRFHGYMTY